MAIQPKQPDGDVSVPVKRLRWATQRITGHGARRKRHSIMDRFHRGGASGERKRESGGSGSATDNGHDGVVGSEDGAEEDGPARRIFFNIPLPEDAKNEQGHPITDFGRNKIRTARYTPLSFIPKDLWYQFHNIANIYFAFLIILAVSLSGPSK